MRISILLVILVVTVTSCNNTQSTSKIAESVVNTNLVVRDDSVNTSEVKIQEEPLIQLIIKNELTDKDLYIDYDGGEQLAEYFLIELIDKDTFYENKSMAVHLLSTDTTVIKKQEGILKLPCKKGEISFIDNLSHNVNHKEYTYIGEIKSLNAFVLSGIYWEDWNYFFINKTDGSTVQTFANHPYLSADGKYIVSLDFDDFEGTTYIDLYEITDNKYVDPIVGMYVKKWIPINTTESMYWGNDNFLYVTVIHNKDYWAADGNYSGLDQYIRLKPIAS